MRHFVRPSNTIATFADGATIRNESGEPEPLDFGKFFQGVLDADSRVGASRESSRLADKIYSIVFSTKPGEVVELEDAEHKFLAAIFEKPSGGYHPRIARLVGPWVDAILDATAGRPAPAATGAK